MAVRRIRLVCSLAVLVAALSTIPPAQASATPQVFVGGAEAVEGDHGRTRITFTLGLTAPADRPVQVRFATADGSAVAGEDYVGRHGVLTFPPGRTERSVDVLVVTDATPEPAEWFTLRLTDARRGTIAVGEATGTITDDDRDAAASLTAAVDARDGWCDPMTNEHGCYLVTVAGSGLLPFSTVTVYRSYNWVDGQTWLTEVSYTADENGDFVHMTDRGYPGEFVRCTAEPDDDGHLDMAWATGTTAAGEPIESNVLSGSDLPC